MKKNKRILIKTTKGKYIFIGENLPKDGEVGFPRGIYEFIKTKVLDFKEI